MEKKNISGCNTIIEGNVFERACEKCVDLGCTHHPDYKERESDPEFFNK